MRVDLPEDLSHLTDAELKSIAADADHVRTEALLALRSRAHSAEAFRRDQRLAGMNPRTRTAVEALLNASTKRLGIVSVLIALGIMALGGLGDCAGPTVETVGTTQRVLRDLDDVMKEQAANPTRRTADAATDEVVDRAMGF